MLDRKLEAIRPEGSLLIVESDKVMRDDLVRVMAGLGYSPISAGSVFDSYRMISEYSPVYAIAEINLADGSGLEVIEAMRIVRDDARVVIFSGYGDLRHAVAAIKAGAVDYLIKPSRADDIDRALRAPIGALPPPPELALDANEVRMEHILNTYRLSGGDITRTANQLRVHRRTLERMFLDNVFQDYIRRTRRLS